MKIYSLINKINYLGSKISLKLLTISFNKSLNKNRRIIYDSPEIYYPYVDGLSLFINSSGNLKKIIKMNKKKKFCYKKYLDN
jgi:hypothetical protein